MSDMISPKWLIVALCLLALAALAGPGSNTASVTVGWSYDFPSNPGVTNFVVYWGPATRAYTNQANAGTNLTFTITGLIRGSTNFFAATAQAADVESDYSNEASKVIPMKPAKPVNFIAQ